MANMTKFKKTCLTIALIIIFVLTSLFSFRSIRNLQGNARVVNYTGIIRGATQRLIKQELNHHPNDALMADLDGIILNLMDGKGSNHLIYLPSAEFQELMKQVQSSYNVIKQEIQQFREGKDPQTLYQLSEDYFVLVDQTVSAAETYSEDQAFKAIIWQISLYAIFCLFTILFAIYNAHQKAIQIELEKAQQASREKGKFLSQISHEIRTPMNGIIGMTSIAQANINQPEKVQDCLDKIQQCSDFMLSLVNDVLDMSKIENGKIILSKQPFDFQELLDSIHTVFVYRAEKKHLDFQVNLHQVTVRAVLGDKLRVRQIIMNLISNAIKFTPDYGMVILDVTQTALEDDRVSFTFLVKDTGVGMSQKFMQKMFEPFTQADSNEAAGGTGLGLPICHNLVTMMGGQLLVESEQGKGTVFTIHLSFALPDEAEKELLQPETSQVADPPDLTGIHILLAEDNELNAEITQVLLEPTHADVVHVWDGEQVVDTFASATPGTFQYILMDVQMPKINGLEATRTIRSLRHLDAQTIPIFALTANAFHDDVQKALDSGMNAHLSKPLDQKALFALLRRYQP